MEMTLGSEMKGVEKKEWSLSPSVSGRCLGDLHHRLRIPESMNVSYRLNRDGESTGARCRTKLTLSYFCELIVRLTPQLFLPAKRKVRADI